MQRYLNQLLADLETATRNAPDASTYRFVPRFREEESEGSDVLQSRFVKLCDLFGLGPDIFPPVDRLTKVQVTNLLTAIENLWRAWHISWECPITLTARRRYSVMVERMSGNPVHYNYDIGARIDFCDERANGKCPFGDTNLCTCKILEDFDREEDEKWLTGRYDLLDKNETGQYADKEGINPEAINLFHKWVYGDDEEDDDLEFWDIDEEKERWMEFMAEEEMVEWMYFYQPQRDDDDLPESDPQDFDDFSWNSGIEDIDLPF